MQPDVPRVSWVEVCSSGSEITVLGEQGPEPGCTLVCDLYFDVECHGFDIWFPISSSEFDLYFDVWFSISNSIIHHLDLRTGRNLD